MWTVAKSGNSVLLRDWSEHMERAEEEQHPVSVRQCLCAHPRRTKILETRAEPEPKTLWRGSCIYR